MVAYHAYPCNPRVCVLGASVSHPLSLSLSHTHTHTHTHSLSLTHSLPLSLIRGGGCGGAVQGRGRRRGEALEAPRRPPRQGVCTFVIERESERNKASESAREWVRATEASKTHTRGMHGCAWWGTTRSRSASTSLELSNTRVYEPEIRAARGLHGYAWPAPRGWKHQP